MKAIKILFLGFCTFLLSCSGGEYFSEETIFDELIIDLVNEHYDNKTYFNPPEWIIGTWYSNEYNKVRVQFKQNNVIVRHFGYGNRWHTNDYNKMLNQIRWGEYSKSLIEETATDTTYFFSIMHNSTSGKPIYNYWQ